MSRDAMGRAQGDVAFAREQVQSVLASALGHKKAKLNEAMAAVAVYVDTVSWLRVLEALSVTSGCKPKQDDP